MQSSKQHRLLLACIFAIVASASSQGIIDSPDYIAAAQTHVEEATTPVRSPVSAPTSRVERAAVAPHQLQTATAPAQDGRGAAQQMSRSNGPGAEHPEMKTKVGSARAPQSARHDDSTLPRQRYEDTTLKQRAHNDNIPQQRMQEDSIPKQRQLDISLPVQRKLEQRPIPAQKQPGHETIQAAAPSGTTLSGQLSVSSAAALSPQSQGPTSHSKEVLPMEMTLVAQVSHPTGYYSAGPSPGAYVSKPEILQAGPREQHGGEQKDLSAPETFLEGQHGITGLQTGAPEIASSLSSVDTDVPGSPFAAPMQLTAGQEALRDLLVEAAAAPAQHSAASYQKAPASRYAMQQGVHQGYFGVWPAPAPCEGFYNVKALMEEHSSPESTTELPRYSTHMAVSNVSPAQAPQSFTGHALAAPDADSAYVQAYSPLSLPEVPLPGSPARQQAVSPSSGSEDIQDSKDKPADAASALSTGDDRALRSLEALLSRSGLAPSIATPAAAPEWAAAAQAPQQLAGMYGQPESIQVLQAELVEIGALAPGPGSQPSALDVDLLSAAYNAGYQAGYKAARKAATGHVRPSHTSLVASSPHPSKQFLDLPEAKSKHQTLHPAELSTNIQQVHPQPQAYGRYGGAKSIESSVYGSKSSAFTQDTKQGTHSAAAYTPEALPAQARYSYGSPAPGYAYQAYAHQASSPMADSQTLLHATAREQAAHFQRKQSTTSAEVSAEAPGPGPTIATQSFAEVPVVRSYPGEQHPASGEPVTAPAPSDTYNTLSTRPRSTSLAPASALAYGGLPAYDAAPAPAGSYTHQHPPAYASEPVSPPTSEPEAIASQPSQALRMQYAPSNGPSASNMVAPGAQLSFAPVEAPENGKVVASAPAPAPGIASGMTYGSIVPHAPAAAPAFYAPLPAMAPFSYGAYGSATGVPATAPSGSMHHILAPSGGLSSSPALEPSVAPLPAPCEVCHRPQGGASPDSAAPEVVLSIVDGSELAQYVTQEGSNANVVYFVARAAFSRPPTNFTAKDVTVVNGTAVDVVSGGMCGQYLVKGYVQQAQATGANSTAVTLSTSPGTLQDCAGNVFPAASASGTVLNRPTGRLQAPDLGIAKNASASGQPEVFLTLTFSQPVLSVSPGDIRVNLTQSTAQGPKNSSSTEEQPGMRRLLAEGDSCVPEATVQNLRGVTIGASRAYSFVIGLPTCFRGKVAVEYRGSAQNLQGVASFPVKPFRFWHPNPGP